MNLTKNKLLKFIILLLLAVTVLTNCGSDDMHADKKPIESSELIENEDLNDISLTIYYISPYILTRVPLSIEDLIKYSEVNKIVLRGNYSELLTRLNNTTLIPVEKKSCLNARLYYVFETEKDGKIYDVALWGGNDSIFANGVEVEENDVFYNVIMQFLPENDAKEFQGYIKNGFQ